MARYICKKIFYRKKSNLGPKDSGNYINYD
jgi:hypothetical protein